MPDESRTRAPVHPELRAGGSSRRCCDGDRRRGRRRALRGDPGAPALSGGCSTSPPALQLRGGAAPPSSRACSSATRSARDGAQLPRRRLLARTTCRRSSTRSSNRARVRDRVLRRDVHRPRQAAGVLRVREPGRRARRAATRSRSRRTTGATAAASAICMAGRMTGRLAGARAGARSRPERRLDHRRRTAAPRMQVEAVPFDAATGPLDLAALRGARSATTSPASTSRTRLPRRARARRAGDRRAARTRAGALAVVGVDPISLGVLEAPPRYGADIVCGELQPLGIHMHYGGGAGRLHRDAGRGALRRPSTRRSWSALGRTVRRRVGLRRGRAGSGCRTCSAARRRDFAGTTQCLWAIARRRLPRRCSGRTGCAELGQGDHAADALRRAAARRAPGRARAARCAAPFFKEFVVDLDDTGRTVAEVNRGARREQGILGGARPLAATSRSSGRARSYCVTEVHTQADIDRLVDALAAAIA